MDIGLGTATYLRRLALYLPEKDRNGETVADIEAWITEACILLAKLNGGVTRLPPARGMWLDSENGGLIEETTHIVFSYISEGDFMQHLDVVRNFIERFRTIANQDAVAVEFDGQLHLVAAPPKPEAIRLAVANE